MAGAFLYWLEVSRDKEIVRTLHYTLRDGKYTNAILEKRCGVPLAALWREFVEQSRAPGAR